MNWTLAGSLKIRNFMYYCIIKFIDNLTERW